MVGHHHGLIGDIGMLSAAGLCGDAHGIFLVGLGKTRDLCRHSCRKHQGATRVRALAKDKLKIFAKPKVEHLVGFIQHHAANGRQVDRAAHDVITKPARCRHHDMRPACQRTAFVAHVHAAHTRGHHNAGFRI